MKVTLKLYAMLQDYLPQPARKDNALTLEVPESATVAKVVEQFNLPPKLTHLVLVNGNFVGPSERATYRLNEGDILAIWPPVAGG